MARTKPPTIPGLAQKTIPLLEGGRQSRVSVVTTAVEIPSGGPLSGRKGFILQNQDGSNNLFWSGTKPVSYLAKKTYEWTLSGSGTNEWYLQLKNDAGDPGLDEPAKIFTATSGGFGGGTETEATEGTVGSLTLGKWAWDDNDSLGYDTVYIRTDGTVPFQYFDVIYGYTRCPTNSGALVGHRLAPGISTPLLPISGNTRIWVIASAASAVASILEFE